MRSRMAFLFQRGKRTVNTVGQPTFLTDFLHQARGESASAKDVITHNEGEIIGIIALEPGIGELDMTLGSRMRDPLRACCWRRHFRNALSPPLARQILRQGFSNGRCLITAYGSHNGYNGVARRVAKPVKIDQILTSQFTHALDFAGTS